MNLSKREDAARRKGKSIMREETKIYLNTWGAYNDGCIGYGWFTPDEARDFMEADPERDGGEWFVADIDNCLGIDFGALEYASVEDIIEQIEALELLEDYELKEVAALMEYNGGRYTIEKALEDLNNTIFYSSIEEYHNFLDEEVDSILNIRPNDRSSRAAFDLLSQYFDYEEYHRQNDFDIFEASNGVVILN